MPQFEQKLLVAMRYRLPHFGHLAVFLDVGALAAGSSELIVTCEIPVPGMDIVR